jgi:hypothetical protein
MQAALVFSSTPVSLEKQVMKYREGILSSHTIYSRTRGDYADCFTSFRNAVLRRTAKRSTRAGLDATELDPTAKACQLLKSAARGLQKVRERMGGSRGGGTGVNSRCGPGVGKGGGILAEMPCAIHGISPMGYARYLRRGSR